MKHLPSQRRLARSFLNAIVGGLLASLLASQPLFAMPQAQGPTVEVGQWTVSDVTDWEAGKIDGLLATNNDGGELRLEEKQKLGSFLSAVFATDFPASAAGATWRLESPQGTDVTFELRGRADPPPAALDDNEGWGKWQPLIAGDAVSQADDGAFATPDVVLLPDATRYLQLRVNFSSEVARASTVLSEVNVSYFNSVQDPPVFTAGLPRQPIVVGPDTLTTRPSLIARATWSGRVLAAQPERADPRGIIIHQIDATTTPSTTLELLRATATYQTDVLGWDDMPYHYVIDAAGTLYEGRVGGPTSLVPRLAGGDNAIHVAVISERDAAPSETAQGTLISLLAWLGQAYGIDPTGEHTVAVGATRSTRPNIAGHNEVAETAPDPSAAFREALPQIRTRTDESTVRARWYFAEGNVQDYSERLSIFNPTDDQADANVTLVPGDDTPLSEIIAVPANSRADVTVNSIISDTTSLPAVVESSAPILVERSLGLTTDIDSAPGITQLSRVWYFAEGSTADTFRTFLALFNPQTTLAEATIAYMQDDGVVSEQQVQIPANQRLVVSVGDSLPNANFGMRVLASQPIAVERTMRFGEDGDGLTTSPGVVALSRQWMFAEGTTQDPFEMRLLVLNPNAQPVNAEVSFLGPDGKDATRRYALPPNSQLSVDVNEVVPDMGVSTMVKADRPVAVERALYFNNGTAGTINAGALDASYTWRFVDGRTDDATYYLLFSNPNRRRADVTVDFVFGDGATGTQEVTVAGNTRYTMAVHEFYPDETSIAATVRSTQPIVAERSLYPGGGTRGGSTSLGIPE